MKRFCVMILALAIAFCACFANAEGTEPVELRFAWWGDTSRHEVYNKICDLFEEQNPNIKIIRESTTYNDYWNKLATQIAGGQAPDVFSMHPAYVADYAARNVMADLQSYIDSGVIETQDIPESILESGRLNGKICMISQGPSGTGIFANRTLLDEVGVEIPEATEDWTWEEYAQKASEFREKALAKGIDAYLSDDWTLTFSAVTRVWLRTNGGELYTQDGKMGFTVKELAEHLDFFDKLRDADLIPDAASMVENSSVTLEQKLFTQGRVALTNVAANLLYQYKVQMPDAELTPVRIPIGPGESRGEYLEGAFVAIYENIDQAHKDAAAQFINFFINTEDSLQYLKMEQGMPTNSKMVDFVSPLLNEEQRQSLDYLRMTGELQDHNVVYAPMGATAISNAYVSNCFENVAYGVMTPEEAAQAFMEEAEGILAENS